MSIESVPAPAGANPQTLTELLDHRAEHQSEKTAYTFLHDGERESHRLTYQALRTRAWAVAARLQQVCAPGERALLLYPSGLEFITAFFGCLYAGVVAVPAYPPRRNRSDKRLEAIAGDAQPMAVLTTAELLSGMAGRETPEGPLPGLKWLDSDDIDDVTAEAWRPATVTADSLAFLQYTSGSTGQPKGVMVSHGNLMHNEKLIRIGFGHSADTRFVGWLPLFHDMGLIGNVLQPLYLGVTCTLMSPGAFLQQPVRWLRAISDYKGTTSGGPNFAYDLCVQKVRPEQCAGLDLSSWEVAFNGAEPVRAGTMERFVRAFEPYGFRREAFYPCYGMAEASLFVCGGSKETPPVVRSFEQASLQQHQVQASSGKQEGDSELVGCGRTWLDLQVVIADPDSAVRCPPGRVGEIWVTGPSVAKGYWNKPEETERTFGACLAENGGGAFLRTGDLGFVQDGELYVTGRVKDVIIIRGQNFYPQDIELTAEHSHRALRPGCGAAFSVEKGGEEQLVVAYEVKSEYRHKVDVEEVVKAVRQRVTEVHELRPSAIVLLKPGGVPKTSSGKIQRHACRTGFLADTLKVLGAPKQRGEDQDPAEARNRSQGQTETRTVSQGRLLDAEALKEWLVKAIAKRCQIRPQEVDAREPFSSYGLDSLGAMTLSGDLGQLLGREVPPTLAYDYPTIDALAGHLAQEGRADENSRGTGAAVQDKREPIALVGVGCRLPGADNPGAFWELLRGGVDAITEVPGSRWPTDANRSWGGFIDRVDEFDPHFFGISPREADSMDPQQRLLMEVSWEALETAGQAPARLAGSQTGVFIGISTNDYSRLQFGSPANVSAYSGTGTAFSIAANRLSYLLDLRGPSWSVDTACSSSLVAVHQACQSLREGECDLAIAGGVNLILSPEVTTAFSQAQMMAEDGRCKAFDADANGYVRGEGCGVVVLKRLSAALRDGDNILCLIRGSAVNQDGRSNGLTAPNGPAQQAVVRRALKNAGVDPAQISYVEAHGTGTALGDPIEVNSLMASLVPGRSKEQPLSVGSVKTNIGHLEAAAGIAGLIKVALALKHEEIPPHLHLKRMNPHIETRKGLLSIPATGQTWPRGKTPRIAGVSSFGFGGTNAHVILQESPLPQAMESGTDRPLHLLTLSAESPAALSTLVEGYGAHLRSAPEGSMADVCFTANTGRRHFKHRLAVVASSGNQLEEKLRSLTAEAKFSGVVTGQVDSREQPKIAFLFPGQSCQYTGMGRHLYDTQPTFRKTLNHCDEMSRSYLATPLLELVYPKQEAQSRLTETAYAQPVLFAFQYALAELWRSWGIEPTAVMGHSVGEYAAACLAGAFSLEDGMRLVAERARLMQSLPQDGEMLAVLADEAAVRAAIRAYGSDVTIAALNGPKNTVISGRRQAVQAAKILLEARGVETRTLQVSHAFHSPLLDPVLDEFEETASRIRFHEPRRQLVSGLTGEVLPPGQVTDAAYWRRQAREPVQFQGALEWLSGHEYKVFLEIGPRPVLMQLGRSSSKDPSALWVPSMKQGVDDWRVLLDSLSRLYARGLDVDWEGFDKEYPRRRVVLPTYPFQRKRYWLRGETQSMAGVGPNASGSDRQHAEQIRRPARAAGKSPASHGGLGRLLGQQLQVMAQQLAMLRGNIGSEAGQHRSSGQDSRSTDEGARTPDHPASRPTGQGGTDPESTCAEVIRVEPRRVMDAADSPRVRRRARAECST